jgi:hypothetical protein
MSLQHNGSEDSSLGKSYHNHLGHVPRRPGRNKWNLHFLRRRFDITQGFGTGIFQPGKNRIFQAEIGATACPGPTA